MKEHKERQYEAGESAYYHNSEDIYKVRVMENNSDENFIRYSLRVIEIKQAGAEPTHKKGDIFTCEKKKDLINVGQWRLLEEITE